MIVPMKVVGGGSNEAEPKRRVEVPATWSFLLLFILVIDYWVKTSPWKVLIFLLSGKVEVAVINMVRRCLFSSSVFGQAADELMQVVILIRNTDILLLDVGMQLMQCLQISWCGRQ